MAAGPDGVAGGPGPSKARTKFLERQKKRLELRQAYERLRYGVVANAGRRSAASAPRWAHVLEATGLGKTSSQQLCRDAGFDPDEVVGGET